MLENTVQAALEPEALRAVLDADCCELLRRPTMGLNLAAASMDCASLFGPVLQEKLEGILPKLNSENFLEKVHFLNLARSVEPSPEQAPEQCKSFPEENQALGPRSGRRAGRRRRGCGRCVLGAREHPGGGRIR